jgi:hypothetical protein
VPWWEKDHQPVNIAALYRLELLDDQLVMSGKLEGRPHSGRIGG